MEQQPIGDQSSRYTSVQQRVANELHEVEHELGRVEQMRRELEAKLWMLRGQAELIAELMKKEP